MKVVRISSLFDWAILLSGGGTFWCSAEMVLIGHCHLHQHLATIFWINGAKHPCWSSLLSADKF